MENELLLATSDGFYYDGTPNQGSYTESKDVKTTTTSAYTSYEENNDVFDKFGDILGFTEGVIGILAVICLFKSVSVLLKNRKEDTENVIDDQMQERINKSKKYYFYLIVLTLAYVCVSFVSEFLEKF